MKIILANSVGRDQKGNYLIHSPSRWSYGCPDYEEVFTYYPWELAYASSLLKRETEHKVKLIDGCLEKLEFKEYLEILLAEKPDLLVMESSSRTISEDAHLAKSLKNRINCKLVFCGQQAAADPEAILSFADYAILGEYEEALLALVSGKNPENIPGLFPNPPANLVDITKIPFPEDEDVSRLAYAYPGEPNCEYVEIQFYTSRGCPFHCNFCVARHLYYGKPNWRARPASDIIAEIIYLRNKYPEMQGLFFDEEVHNLKKSHVTELCQQLLQNNLQDLKINAMCTYSTFDEEMLAAMKAAGYYKLRIGIETASEKVAKAVGMSGKYNLENLNSALELAKKIGMKIYGTFTVGALGSTAAEDAKTAHLVENLVSNGLIHDLQVSICTPQPGTPFYNLVKKKGYLQEVDYSNFDGGARAVVNYPGYPAKAIEENFQQVLSAYDQALEFRCQKDFIKNCSEALKNNIKGAINKIIIFRSARLWQVNLILKSVSQIFPQAKRIVVAQKSVAEKLKENPLVDKVFIYGEGFFNINTFPKKLLSELSKLEIDLALIPGTHPKGLGYSHPTQIAKIINSKKVFYLDRNGQTIEK